MNTEAARPEKLFSHFVLAIGGSILVLAGLFYAVSHAGHDVSPARLRDIIKAMNPGYILAYALMMLLGILLRAWRYQILLRASGEANLPSYKDMALITAVRNMTVDLLPARLGELAFVALLRTRAGTQVSSGLSALLFATLLDILILAPITILIGLAVGFPNKQPYLLALIALFVVVVFLLGLKFILPLTRNLLVRYSVSRSKAVSAVSGFLLAIDRAVESTMSAGVFNAVLGITVGVRFFKYAGLLCLYYGLTQANFPSLAELNAFSVLGAMIASEMTASLPIPALMSFGTWELGGMTLLAFFGAVPQLALLTMLGVHITTQALDYGIGLATLAALFLFNGKSKEPSQPGLRLRPLIGILFVLFATGIGWLSYEQFNVARNQPVNASHGVAQDGGSKFPAWLGQLDGMIVWSSNRSGIHNIWLMNLPDMSMQQLTDTPHTENFARISPDGTRVVFSRSHQEWQSLRDEKPWDIWVLDLRTLEQKRVAQWGQSPSWSPDGKEILFKRDPGQLIAVDAQTFKERVYYESGKDDFMKSPANMATPTIGEDGRLAFTYRNRGQPTNVIRDSKGKFSVVHRDSCQVMWAPSGDFVTYVQKGGKQINQIMRFDPETQKKTRLIDLPGEYSHEYFPRMSANEAYMVFSASNGGHEHDIADYELFIWPVGADSSDAVRLTFDSGNDSWPDIWLRK